MTLRNDMALSNAERQAAWRARHAEKLRNLEQGLRNGRTDNAAENELRNENSKLRNENSKLRNENSKNEKAEIKRLKDEIKHLKREFLESMMRAKAAGPMPKETFRALVRCLHTDTRPTDAERTKALQMLLDWRPNG